MTGPQQETPPVAEWLRGQALTYRRGAATCARDGRPADADVYRRVALALGDVADAVDAYLSGAVR